MKAKYSNILKIIICIVLIIVFTIGFNQGQEIDDFAYAIAIGIDTSENNNLKVSFQFAKPVNASEGGTSDTQPSFIYTIEASSISSAINLLDSYMSKQVILSHCKVIVFSEEFAKNGISKELYTLINKVQIRPDVGIIISRCNATYFIEESKPTLENLVTKYYEIAPSSTEYTGYTSYIKIGDFFNSLNCKTCEPYAILGGVNTTSQSQAADSSNPSNIEKDSDIKAGETSFTKNSGAENLGLAIFKDDKLVGEASAIDALCHLIVTNNLKTGLISIPNPFDQSSSIDLAIYKHKNTKKNVEFINNSPYITVDAYVDARVLSVSGNSESLTDENISIIEEGINLYLKDKISEYLYKTSIDFNSDVCGFGRYAINKFLTTEDWDNYNWLDNYKNSIFKINVESSVKSGLLLTQD